MNANGRNRFCVVVPAFREEGRIGGVVRGILGYCNHVLVVDDGSPDGTAAEAEQAGAEVLRHAVNRGKGAALETGFRRARECGFEFLLTMDADGQHAPEDIPAFVAAYESTGLPVLVGTRMDNPAGMPRVRWWTNRFMSWMLSRRMGQRVPDTQNGYRLYRCDVLGSVTVESTRFAAESEILLALACRGVTMGSVPTRVIYRDERSKISPLKDAFRFFRMLRAFRRRGRARPRNG